MTRIENPEDWFTRAARDDSNNLPASALAHGTVGCVACDSFGRLAAGTSTAGVFGKMAGRVGDTPILGAGVWSDKAVAVSCTGQGEYFMRTVAAAQVGLRMRLLGEDLASATRAALQEVTNLGGEGGMIAVSAKGEVSMPFASEGMKRAALHADGRIVAEAF